MSQFSEVYVFNRLVDDLLHYGKHFQLLGCRAMMEYEVFRGMQITEITQVYFISSNVYFNVKWGEREKNLI